LERQREKDREQGRETLRMSANARRHASVTETHVFVCVCVMCVLIVCACVCDEKETARDLCVRVRDILTRAFTWRCWGGRGVCVSVEGQARDSMMVWYNLQVP
jgi:hypothetical protein